MNKVYIKITIKVNILVNPLIFIYFNRKKKAIKIYDLFIKIKIFTIITLIKLYFLDFYLTLIKILLINYNYSVNKNNVKINFY